MNLEVYFVHRCLTKEIKCNLNLTFKAYKSRKTQKETKLRYSFYCLASREVIGLHFNAFLRRESEI